MITNYVVGFAFDAYDAVALIHKQKPAWQKDRWNGVGGKVEDSDPTIQFAMSREFHEETGQGIVAESWRHVGRILEPDCTVQIFTTRVPLLRVRTTTNEIVKVFTIQEQCLLGTEHYPCILNIPVFLEMCRLGPDAKRVIPFFTLDYTHAE